MHLKKLEDIQNGETMEFIQMYVQKEPEIFCKNFRNKDILSESYSFLKEILDNLRIPYEFLSEDSKIPKFQGEDYSYEGMGRCSKDIKGKIKIWRIPGYSYNKRHLGKYQEKFSRKEFDDDFREREEAN